jgi:hypothetical protein
MLTLPLISDKNVWNESMQKEETFFLLSSSKKRFLLALQSIRRNNKVNITFFFLTKCCSFLCLLARINSDLIMNVMKVKMVNQLRLNYIQI